MSQLRLALAVVLAVAAAACGAKRIPGTEIRDTDDNRAIVQLIDAYRQAAERRDAEAVLALVSPQYFDDAGTPDPGDDVDFAQLQRLLPANYKQLTAVRLGIGVRGVDVKGDRGTANVFYDGYYRVATSAGDTAKSASDVSQMRFVREDGRWKIAGGL